MLEAPSPTYVNATFFLRRKKSSSATPAVTGTSAPTTLIGAINPDFIQVTAIADVRPYNVHRAFHGDYYSETARADRCGLMTKYGCKTEDEARQHVKVYADWRELIKEEKDIEAVIIALPLHLQFIQ